MSFEALGVDFNVYSPDPKLKKPKETRRARLAREARALGLTPTELTRQRYVKAVYGITMEERDKLIAKQGGRCAICQVKFGEDKLTKPHIDHDHHSKRIRGILCTNCNVGLGMFRDDTRLLTKAKDYLSRP